MQGKLGDLFLHSIKEKYQVVTFLLCLFNNFFSNVLKHFYHFVSLCALRNHILALINQ